MARCCGAFSRLGIVWKLVRLALIFANTAWRERKCAGCCYFHDCFHGGWWVRGLALPSPFFDERTGAPRAAPRVLTGGERGWSWPPSGAAGVVLLSRPLGLNGGGATPRLRPETHNPEGNCQAVSRPLPRPRVSL